MGITGNLSEFIRKKGSGNFHILVVSAENDQKDLKETKILKYSDFSTSG
jgi:hypothetical protein